MNYIDILILVMLFFCFAIGWKLRGVYLAIVPIAFFVGIITANLGYSGFSNIMSFITNETKRLLISYTLLFLLGASLPVLAAITTASFFDFFKITFIDRALGAILFIFITFVPMYFLFAFLDKTVQLNVLSFHENLQGSFMFSFVEKYVQNLIHLPVMKHLSVIENIWA